MIPYSVRFRVPYNRVSSRVSYNRTWIDELKTIFRVIVKKKLTAGIDK